MGPRSSSTWDGDRVSEAKDAEWGQQPPFQPPDGELTDVVTLFYVPTTRMLLMICDSGRTGTHQLKGLLDRMEEYKLTHIELI